MFQLKAAAAPEWREFEPGIRLQLRYGPSEALAFGRRHTRTLMKADDRRDPEFAFVAGILIWAVIAWDGIGTPKVEGEADDAPIAAQPLTAEALAALLTQRPDIYDDLNSTYVEAVLAARDEKNGSGTSLTGTSPSAVPNTAKRARKSAKPAPTRSTSRKAKPAKSSGASSRRAATS